ncbi:phosphotransferase [Anaeromicropila herbilytica]|uniref:Aminoglycoside phosphotransferase domain-containing protein n=1 Tax=Anaeromicropila herbilytica TaxID=2785025 RepID=A0A7R7EL52_9FIRM|nr:phosphotransferase [Anaeromicropila herbilytica]BCN30896.1 hypothetical protein bsdtb5_21910 [Anaeromicropila herbilytica]
MEKENIDILYDLCLNFSLGNVIGGPIEVKGGLLHKMFKVTTDQGDYAIKCLNPAIMSRECALNNTINSEKISETLGLKIPAISAIKIGANHVHQYNGEYFMFFDWIDGQSVYPPEITEEHCNAIGDLIGKIHSLDVSIQGLEDKSENIEIYEWKEFLEMGRQNNSTWVSTLEDTLEDIMNWNQNVLNAKAILSNERVSSHRDLDPKNVLWQGNCPFIIDWEAAGYVNPYQELLEVLNYWADDGNGGLHRNLFMAILDKYKLHNSISKVNWDVVLDSGYEGMLGWLEYNLKRALGIEVSNEDEIKLGEEQVIATINELKRYQEKISLMKEWL